MQSFKEINILVLGDVFGRFGRLMLQKHLLKIQQAHRILFTIVNGENITHGKSISFKHYQFLKTLGVDAITSGNHIFGHPDVKTYISDQGCDLLKPLNMNLYTPGQGSKVWTKQGIKIRVTNLIGRAFMAPADNYFSALDHVLKHEEPADIHLVDMHAEATAEKIACAWHYDGQLSMLYGTHTHVQTADERLLPEGTAFITDIGMVGCWDSIIGLNPSEIIKRQQTALPYPVKPAKKGVGILCGAVLTINPTTFQPTAIKRVFVVDKNLKP